MNIHTIAAAWRGSGATAGSAPCLAPELPPRCDTPAAPQGTDGASRPRVPATTGTNPRVLYCGVAALGLWCFPSAAVAGTATSLLGVTARVVGAVEATPPVVESYVVAASGSYYYRVIEY